MWCFCAWWAKHILLAALWTLVSGVRWQSWLALRTELRVISVGQKLFLPAPVPLCCLLVSSLLPCLVSPVSMLVCLDFLETRSVGSIMSRGGEARFAGSLHVTPAVISVGQNLVFPVAPFPPVPLQCLPPSRHAVVAPVLMLVCSAFKRFSHTKHQFSLVPHTSWFFVTQ